MLRALTRAETSGTVFAAAIALCYGVLPLAVYTWAVDNAYFLQLATVAGIGAACVVLGSRIRTFDENECIRIPQVSLALEAFLALVWGSFIAFVVVACITADRIPLVAALQGVDPDTLADLRERFLKAREGWQSSFVYMNALLVGALVPYSLMAMLLHRHRHRWLAFGLFLAYCVSFSEKAFFLKAAIPLTYLVVQRKLSSRIRPEAVIGAAVGVFVLITAVSGTVTIPEATGEEEFFSAGYRPQGAAAFIAWRALSIPVVTAADTLQLFDEQFRGWPLMGASSSLLAGLFGQERVYIEREVFAAQWGQTESGTGSANSVYLTEAFVNFGYPGVVLLSIAVGLVLRLIARSQDEALRSLWMLFCFNLLVSPLIATLFSNGFLLVIALSLTVKLDAGDPAREERCPPSA